MIKRYFSAELKKRLRSSMPLLQILIGPRQVGKTTAAADIFEGWKGPKIMVTADSPSPPHASWIDHHWEQARLKGHGTLLVIDEIQKVPGWSEQVKICFDADRGFRDIRILLLGSSSLYLQKGLRESLAGRFELTRAHHWSFHEFEQSFGWDFDTYLRFGAYPGAVSFIKDAERWRSYILDSIIEPVLGKDILGQYPVRSPALFRQTFELATHYPAQVISLQKLLGQLQDRGNAATIKHYLNLLEQSFLIKTLPKYTGSIVSSRAASPKILILNQALSQAYQPKSKLDHDTAWFGHVFENIVGSHLYQLPNSELYYWREGSDEVDFVVKTPGRTFAIEIKSGTRSTKGGGVRAFSRRYSKVACEVWDRARALRFLRTGYFDCHEEKPAPPHI